MAPFKLDHVVIISPGSRYVNAQIGVGESPTPPKFRFPSRMFPTDVLEQWEPVKIRVRKRVRVEEKTNGVTNGTKVNAEQTDTTMTDVQETNGAAPKTPKPAHTESLEAGTTAENGVTQPAVEEEEYFEEDPESDEDAVWPIVEGRIENYPCFFALLTHVWTTLNPSLISPVIIIAQPAWTMRDLELITRLAMQLWNAPGIHIADAATMATYGVGAESALVVDVGYDKCDITPIYQQLIDHTARRAALKNCGGHTMTKNLKHRLEARGFDENMAEQLKRSAICEILPVGSHLPVGGEDVSNPAAAASTGATASGANATDADGIRLGQAPRGPGEGTDVGQGDEEDNEGVLDVASIVARDNAAELLAKREQEKAAKVAAKKGGAQDASKQFRLRNSEREKATFTYKERVQDVDGVGGDGEQRLRAVKKEIDVGVERFLAADTYDGETLTILETMGWNIYQAIMGVQNLQARSVLWDNILVCGNGSRIKGFKDALMSLLVSRYKLSPSTATIFTSELPSNFTTPVATPGTNTPVPGQSGHALHHPAGHGVNPLLVAATRNVMQPGPGQHLQVPGHATPVIDHSSREGRPSSQAPSSIKYCKLPEYMPEWKDVQWSSFEEASFAGAQVLASMIFSNSKESQDGWFLSRIEFNDEGPSAISQYCLGYV